MATDFLIPKVGEGIEEVTIVNWLAEDGATVNEGEDILEIETDKATAAVPATASGYLHIGPYEVGDVVPVLTVVATIGEEEGAFEPGQGEEKPADTAEPAPAADAESKAEAADSPAGKAESGKEKEAAGAASAETAPGDSGPRATPVAQKMAADMGVDLRQIGDGGRITKEDVMRAAEPARAPAKAPAQVAEPEEPAPAPPSPAATQPTTAPSSVEVSERTPLKGIRGVIARRMAESVQTTARVTLVTEVDATEFVSLRERLKAKFAEEWGFAPGYNDLLALIVANALRQFPFMNARLSEDGEAVEQLAAINMGMAVDTERGLMVPVIRDVDQLGLREFGASFRELVDRARAGKSSLEDLSGGTFTITNLGMYRVDAFTPVINLPEAAILGVGRITPKPVVKADEIIVRKMMTLSLVFDHRLADGAPAARFLDYICELVEEPTLMFLTKR